MLCDEDVQIVQDVINAYRSGTLDIARDMDKIDAAVAVVREHMDDPKLCSSTIPTGVAVGDTVCFVYNQPDVNEPFRFGVVDSFNAGCWVTFTFNIKRRRDRKKDAILKDGPSFRSYDLEKMTRLRLVCRPAVEDIAPAVAEDLAHFGQNVRELFRKFFPGP